ncbi:hypothetical protein V1477_008247 [Vespula maculifrons]|uniref:Uncharacterized protein n=1 Tax=Vespula maculifrons TaxID=7453 RepID=A0ABD2CEQ8_VESMC
MASLTLARNGRRPPHPPLHPDLKAAELCLSTKSKLRLGGDARAALYGLEGARGTAAAASATSAASTTAAIAIAIATAAANTATTNIAAATVADAVVSNVLLCSVEEIDSLPTNFFNIRFVNVLVSSSCMKMASEKSSRSSLRSAVIVKWKPPFDVGKSVEKLACSACNR